MSYIVQAKLDCLRQSLKISQSYQAQERERRKELQERQSELEKAQQKIREQMQAEGNIVAILVHNFQWETILPLRIVTIARKT